MYKVNFVTCYINKNYITIKTLEIKMNVIFLKQIVYLVSMTKGSLIQVVLLIFSNTHIKL